MKLKNETIPYAYDALFRRGKPPVYQGRQLDQIAFPLGGLGTGSMSLGGWGNLRDAEIFNRPAKGEPLDYAFFTLHVRSDRGRHQVTRVLQGPVGGTDFTGRGSGVTRLDGSGLPHFAEAAFAGRFPFAGLSLSDPAVPLKVSMEAWNPFIPGNADDSGLPAALFLFHLENPGEQPVEARLFANLPNKVGHPEPRGNRIEAVDRDGVRGLSMTTTGYAPDSPRYGSLALVTPWKKVAVQTHWRRGGWFDMLHDFWDQAETGELREDREPAELEKGIDVGSIGLTVKLKGGEKATLPVWIVWHTPTCEKYWHKDDPKPTWKNYYATQFADAWAVAAYLGREHERLERETRMFADALWGSTLPAAALDAVASQLSILKTTTCLRLEDGTFYGFEGCNPGSGCCEGTCTHVWNYAQALPYLFPELERGIRETDYRINQHDSGMMTFRMPLPLGTKPDCSFHPAADGQMGGILKVYREWLLCGDDAWLRRLWPKVKKALEYAWVAWDMDRDGVMEGVQHNTYDIEFHGPNTMMGSFYLGALRAAEEMALQLGETESAAEYRRLFELGRAICDAELFNGEYYEQIVKPGTSCCGTVGCGGTSDAGQDSKAPDQPKYQYGKGCLSDQLIGQWYARMLRLGSLFEDEHVWQTLASIFKYNWRPTLREHANPQRIYALNDEAGLLLCSWPRGERPGLPFVYSDEVWCGIEYQVASHLIYEGFVEEGLAIVKGVRDRHDGTRRNPWNEFECGNHYARSLASYSLLLALSDFFYSAPAQSLSFSPKVYQNDFACFFAVDSAWGMLRQKEEMGECRIEIEVLAGSLTLANVQVGVQGQREPVIEFMGERQDYESFPTDVGTLIRLFRPVTLYPGHPLTVTL